jgi:hypothetical protein
MSNPRRSLPSPMSFVLLVLLPSCAAAPPPVAPPERASAPVTAALPVSAVMKKFSEHLRSLHALVDRRDAQSESIRAARLRVLADITELSVQLKRSFNPLTHPALVGGMDAFERELERAWREAGRAAGLAAAANAASACSSCHFAGPPSGAR